MANPIRSELDPSGGYRVSFDDGVSMLLPPTADTERLHASLGSPMAGATAATDEERIRAAMGAAAHPPVRSDATAAGPITTVNAAPVAPPAPPPTGMDTSRIEGALAAQMPGASPMRAPVVAGPIQTIETRMPAPTEFGAPMPVAAPAAPRMAPVTRIKGGPMTTGWQENYTRYPEGLEDAYSDIRIDTALAAQTEQEAARKRADDIEVASRLANRRREEMEAKLEKQRQDQLEAQRRAQRDIALTQERISEMEINPERWLDDKSTIAQIGLVIANAMGTLGSSMTGRDNPIQKMIDARIAADIDAQKAKIAQSNLGLSEKRGLYADMLKLHGDEQAATLATQAALERMIARGMEQRALRISDPEWKAQTTKTALQMSEQSAQTMERLGAVKVSENIANVPDRIVGGGPIAPAGGVDPNDPTATMDKKSAEQFRKLSDELADHVGAVNDLRSASEAVATSDAGTGIIASRAPTWALSQEGNRVRGKVTAALGRYGKATYGAMTAEEYERAKATATGSGTRAETLDGLNTLLGGTRAAVENKLKKYPADVQEAYRRAHPNLFADPVQNRKAPGQ